QVPVVLAHLEQQVVAGDAGVVDEDVDPTQVRDDPLDRGLDGGGVGHVGADADGLGTPGDRKPAGRLARGGLVEVDDRDRGALLGEPGGGAEPDPARCTGDDGDPSIETTHG